MLVARLHVMDLGHFVSAIRGVRASRRGWATPANRIARSPVASQRPALRRVVRRLPAIALTSRKKRRRRIPDDSATRKNGSAKSPGMPKIRRAVGGEAVQQGFGDIHRRVFDRAQESPAAAATV